jgi:hypothetical protein
MPNNTEGPSSADEDALDPRDYFIDSIPTVPDKSERLKVAEKSLEEIRKILRGIADEAQKKESENGGV